MAKVYLVGAGPGDIGLLTLKATELLKKADTIIYDRLAEPRMLSFAREGAEKIYVGKASSNHSMKQEDINKLLVQKGKENKTVVRLKGGDPFVFGRGGEEALALQNENIPFEVVPGVTSAIAALSYAGIPITHRKIAASFAVVTGHEDPTKSESSVRWKELSTAVDTLVFLMGVENLAKISQKLIENGRDENTPAALVRYGTRTNQEVLITSVKNAAEDAQKANLKPPAVFVVGDVVNLREKLDWFSKKNLPFFGKRFLVTRTREQASKLSSLIEENGGIVTEAPTIKLVPPSDNYIGLDNAINDINSYSWLIFTSANGVREFFNRLYNSKNDARLLGNLKIAVIGQATAESLKSYGIIADVVPDEFRAEGLIDALKDKLSPKDTILIPRAEDAREILPNTLKQFAEKVEVVSAYKTITEENSEIRDKILNDEIDVVTFTSSSTVTNFIKLIGDVNLLKKIKTACIGPITATTLRKTGIEPTIIASEYTILGLVEAMKLYF